MEIKAKRHYQFAYFDWHKPTLFTLSTGEGQAGPLAGKKLQFQCDLAVQTVPIHGTVLTFHLIQKFSGDPRPKPQDTQNVSCHWSFRAQADIQLLNQVLFHSSGENQGVLTDDIWGYEDKSSARIIHKIDLGNGGRTLDQFPMHIVPDTGERVLTIQAELEIVLKINASSQKSFDGSSAVELGLLAQKRGDASEITIKCGTEDIKAHKFVLTCCSPVFARMLNSPMDESRTRVIKIDDFEAGTIQDMITFMYGGTLQASSINSIVALLDCAEKYDIPELKAFVVKLLMKVITPDNAIELAGAVVNFGCDEDSQKEIFRYCKTNFQKLKIHPNFRQFFKDHVDLFLNC